MHHFVFPFAFVYFLFSAFQSIQAQSQERSVFVIVHGTWGGGWAFKKVDSLLSTTGSIVYRPTLTGQGERVHLATDNVGLQTHILDIVNTILYEDLHNVILVGHSYGGMIISGVADSIPERIGRLVYLDAFVPENNENVISLFLHQDKRFQPVNGFIIPFWVPEGQQPPKDVPQPQHTWSDRIVLNHPERLRIPSTYILTVNVNEDPEKDEFFLQAERARVLGWPVLQIAADHNPHWSVPGELVRVLTQIGQNK
jgi:pimeloyl-ACP methyl ester carboxylesterase